MKFLQFTFPVFLLTSPTISLASETAPDSYEGLISPPAKTDSKKSSTKLRKNFPLEAKLEADLVAKIFEEQDDRIEAIFGDGPRKQNEPCSFNFQCAEGLVCYRAFTSSSCQPSYTRRCFTEAFESVAEATRTSLIDKVVGTVDSFKEDPEETLRTSLLEVSYSFTQELIDFANRFNQCSVKSPDFKLPKGISQGTDGRLRKDGAKSAEDATVYGFEIPTPRLNMGLTMDLGALFGGSVYLGITADASRVNFTALDFTNMTIPYLQDQDIRFGTFGNLCRGLALGAGSKFQFSAGLSYFNLTSPISTAGVTNMLNNFLMPDEIEELPGAKNFCSSLDAAAGYGIGYFFCGIGWRKMLNNWLFTDEENREYYFEIGGSTGPGLGGDLSTNKCGLRSYLPEGGIDFEEVFDRDDN